MGRHKARRDRSGRHPVYSTVLDRRQLVRCSSGGGTMKQRLGSEDEANAEAAYQWALHRRRMLVYLVSWLRRVAPGEAGTLNLPAAEVAA